MTSIEPTTALLQDEDAHEDAAIEWWFIQGWFECRRTRHHFMTTLFRSNFARPGEPRRDGYQLLNAVLDDGNADSHRTLTWIDPGSLAEGVARLGSGESHVDGAVQRALAEELAVGGPPRPVVRRDSGPAFCGAPLHLQWDGFQLAQRDRALFLDLPMPDTHEMLSVRIDPTEELLEVQLKGRGPAASLAQSMAYRCYPRAQLRGTLGADAGVIGEAWIDHQWGDAGWFWDSRHNALLGWDWFGISFDDGASWVVMQHRDARSGAVIAMHATARDARGRTHSADEVVLTPLRHWESPDTRIRYPVQWRIEVPALGAVLEFAPLADAQEVPSFGTLRAVWEGAGTVSGTVNGARVLGRARGELHGYGYVFDYHDFLARLGERVDRRLEEFLPRELGASDVERIAGPARWRHEVPAYTQAIARPVWDLIDRAGKRWRPIFGLLLLEAFGVRSQPWERLICAMTELLHTGALIVDDIEDASQLRRGEEAIHLRYGVDVALNAANALYFLPAAELMSHPLLTPEKRLRMHEIKERVCIEAHCGQATDIYWSHGMTPAALAEWLEDEPEARILQAYDFKTAAGARGLAEFAAVVADADALSTAACVEFARAFALSFQILDDVHNFSDSPRWTKTTGEDVTNGKLTYVIAGALKRLDATRRARLAEILCTPELRSAPGTLAEAVDLVRTSGALEDCRAQAQLMTEQAWAPFARHLPASEPKIMLHAMCLKTLELAFDA